MQINKNNNRKKYIIVGVIAGLLLLGGVAYALMNINANDTTSSKPTKEETKAGNSAKLETLNEDTTSTEQETASNSSKNEEESLQSDTRAVIRVTAKNQNGSLYQIRTMIDVVETGGTCSLTLSDNTNTVTKQVQAQALAKATTCQGFDVPVSELSVGNWDMNIVYENGDTTAEVNDSIEVK